MSQLANAELAGDNPTLQHETTKGKSFARKIPGVDMLMNLESLYGLKFLLMLAMCCHWCKGFNLAMLGHGFKFLMGDYKITGPIVDKYTAAVRMPWAMKPLVGLASDAFPIAGYKKLPYLFVTAILGSVGLVSVMFPIGTFPVEVVALGVFLGNINWMACDILAEGMYSYRLREHPESGPDLVVFVWMGQQMTAVLSSLIAGPMIDYLGGYLFTGGQWVMGTTLIPTVLVVIPAFLNFFGEPKVNPETLRQERANLKKQPELITIALMVGLLAIASGLMNILVESYAIAVSFTIVAIVCETMACLSFFRPVIGMLVLYKAIESSLNLAADGPAYYFFMNGPAEYPEGPHFSAVYYVTVLGVCGNFVAMVALAGYSRWCGEMTYRKVKGIFIIFAFLTQLPTCIVYSRLNVKWGIPDHAFVLGDQVMRDAVSLLYFMPTFLILSRVCPKNIESTLFAVLAATSNFCVSGSISLSGFVCGQLGVNPSGAKNESAMFDNLWIANLIFACVKLVPLAFLWLMPPHKQTEVILRPEDNTSATVHSPYKRCTGQNEDAQQKETK